MKRPEEADKIDDPMYCKYHRLVGHSIEKCFVFKEKIMDLARKGLIELDFENVSTNVISTTCDYDDSEDEDRVWYKDPKPAHAVWVESGNCDKAYWVDFTPPSWSQVDIPIIPTGWGDEEDEEEHAPNDKVIIKFGSMDPVEVQSSRPWFARTFVNEALAKLGDAGNEEVMIEENNSLKEDGRDKNSWALVARQNHRKPFTSKITTIKGGKKWVLPCYTTSCEEEIVQVNDTEFSCGEGEKEDDLQPQHKVIVSSP